MSYKIEFNANFELGFKLSEHTYLTDKSYRHDVCPSFYFKKDNQYYVLWVDYATPSQREDTNSPRYVVQLAKNEGDEEHPEIYAGGKDIVFEANTPNELNLYLLAMFK